MEMGSRIEIFIFLSVILVIQLSDLSIAQPDFMGKWCANGNYTTNSTYRKNIDSVLSSISSLSVDSTIDNYGFYNLSAGENSDTVYAISLCRGDVEIDVCRSCVNDSIPTLIRYSNQSLFRRADTSVRFYMCNNDNATSVDKFNDVLRDLLDELMNEARDGGSSLRKFATGEKKGPDFTTIYGLVQCTPDLSGQDCWNCLDQAAQNIPGNCGGRKGGRIIFPSCNLRYEVYRFYGETPAPPPLPPPPPPQPALPPPPPSSAGNDNKTRTTVIAVVVSIVVFILLVCISFFLMNRRRKRKEIMPRETWDTTSEISNAESLQYDFGTIRAATDDFSDANKLGQGGFGSVYKGKLPNGQEIAVKRLSKDSGQGESEFKNEVLLVARLQHRNLVRLFGFCLEGEERLLIYEFVPNASLDHFIFDPTKRADLNWDKRYKIIAGIARGLLYLHEDSRLRVIHRDLKASNILLDDEMTPKIADFGTARMFIVDETQGATSKIVGTYGYMAPEYVMHGFFSIKSDVFSFGVLVLEIVSGQRNNCFRNGGALIDLLNYAWKNWREGTAANLIDPGLRAGPSPVQDIMRCIHIALLCVQEDLVNRPTMASIVLMLGSSSVTLAVPSQPPFIMHTSSGSSSSGGGGGGGGRRNMDAETQLTPKNYNSASDDDPITQLHPR